MIMSYEFDEAFPKKKKKKKKITHAAESHRLAYCESALKTRNEEMHHGEELLCPLHDSWSPQTIT